MRLSALLAVALLVVPSWWSETNSHALQRRGLEAWEAKRYRESADQYRRALKAHPDARAAFNLGTAEIAAGQRAEGAATLERAMSDPSVRADALFNRGNGALGAGAFDHAIRDFTEALRVRPDHQDAKRNLEIALARRDASRRSGASGQRDARPQSQQQQPAPGQGEQPKESELDVQALLRSVQQQEQEELRRMKGKAAEGRVGW